MLKGTGVAEESFLLLKENLYQLGNFAVTVHDFGLLVNLNKHHCQNGIHLEYLRILIVYFTGKVVGILGVLLLDTSAAY